jgi:hypothetical protein
MGQLNFENPEMTLDQCLKSLVALAKSEHSQKAVSSAKIEVDAYLASFDDPAGKFKWRAELVLAFREIAPDTDAAGRILEELGA